MNRLPTPEDMATIKEAVETIRPVVDALEGVSAAPAVDPEILDAAARAIRQARPALDAAQRVLSGDAHRLFGTRIRDAMETLRR